MAQAFPHRKYYYDFDPRSLGACIAWYDGMDSNSILYDTSGLVTTWLDKSGENRHLTQADPNRRPGFRLSGVDISFGGQRLDTSGFPRELYEIFAVGIADASSTASNTLFHSGNNQRLFSFSNAFPGGTVWIKTPVSALGTWASLPDGRQPTTVSLRVFRNLGGGLHMNGCNSSSVPTFTTRADVSYIGNEATVCSPWGVLNEMIVYSNFLTFKQRRFLEGYLAHKWRTANIIQQPPTGFVPTDISGCGVWLDANDETQFDLSGSASNSVWVWKDKSGNGWDFSQNTIANRPVYVTTDNYKYINFTAASQQTLRFSIPFLSNAVYNRAFSFFAVVTRDVAQANNCFFGATVNSTRNQLIAGWRSGVLGVDFNGDNTQGSQGAVETSNANVNPQVVYFEHFGGTAIKQLYSNGLHIVRRQPGGSNLLGGTNQSIGIANLGAGGTPYYQGRVCEVIFYDRVLPKDDVQKVHGYLFDKWHKPPNTPLVYRNHEHYYVRNPVVRDFRPSDLRECVLWLDAADPTSYTIDSNNVLTSWLDKSSNQNNADICGNPIYTMNPTNGKYGFYFNQPSFARGRLRETLSSNTFTAIVAGSIDSSGATRGRIFGVAGRLDVSDFNDASGVVFLAKTSTSNRICYMKSSATTERAPCDSSWNVPNVMMSGYDSYFFGVGQQMLHNNGVRGTTSAGTPTTFGVSSYTLMGTAGCNVQDNANGYVFEAILYNSYLGYSEIEQVKTYLGRKWGIDISSSLYRANVPPTSIGERPNATSLGVQFGTQQFNCILWLDAMDSNTYSVSNNFVTRLESKSVYGGSLTTSLGATYLPGYNATGLNGRPCFTTSTTNPGPRLYGTFAYATTTWSGVRAFHTVIMVVEATDDVSGPSPRIFSAWGGTGDDSTTGSGFAIATSNTTSPYTITPLRFSNITASNIPSYRSPAALTTGVPTIISYTGGNAGGNMTPTTWAIGSVANTPTITSNIWNLKVSEVLAFIFTPSTTEIQAIEGYLARKWGIDLSTNHTYKYVRP